MALVTTRAGGASVGAQLLGFVAEHEGRLGLAPFPRYRRTYDAASELARQLLSDAAFDAAYRAGAKLSLDEAVALALA